MACGSSFYEENPVKDRQREESSAEKHLKAAKKISHFIQKRLGAAALRLQKPEMPVTKSKDYISKYGGVT